jgi:UDPglucose 6-dehydrogenase
VASVGIFGAGWVGLVTGVCFAELGHDVVVRDVVPEKIAALQAGEVPFHEADVPDLLERNSERLRFTLDAADLAGCRFLFVCVDTPPTKSGDADLSRVWTVVDDLPELDGRAILVMKSTVPVGTGERIRHGLDERGLGEVGYVSNPEFLAEGTAVHDFMEPDRIAIGAFEDADGDAVAGLYSALEAPIVRCDVNSAEMIKLAANAALMTRISFINEIANVCEARSRTCARRRARMSSRWRRVSATTSGSGRTSSRPASGTEGVVSRRTPSRSSSSRRIRATTSSFSLRSSR